MKIKTKSLLLVAMSVILIAGLSVSALAADGFLTLKVSPIKVMVNGETFQPKDAGGNNVMVFTYNGTTYAPLRALAETYDLEVGYDQSRNMATVNKAGYTPVQKPKTQSKDFSSQWKVTAKPVSNYGNERIFTAEYAGNLSMNEFKAWWKSLSTEEIEKGAEQLAAEAQSTVAPAKVTMYFSYGQYSLGTAYGFNGYQQSNFNLANTWIK